MGTTGTRRARTLRPGRAAGAGAGVAVALTLGLLVGCSSPNPEPLDPILVAPTSSSPPPSPTDAEPAPTPEPVEVVEPVEPAPAPETVAPPPTSPAAPAPEAAASPTTDAATQVRSAVDALNAARTAAGVSALTRHEGLTSLAQAQADHYGRGATEWDGDLGSQLAAAGFATGSALARNGAVGDVGGAVTAWLADGEARTTLTDPRVSAVGLAQAPLPDGRPMVVVVVGYRADDGSIPAGSAGAAEALDLTNAERAAFGVPALTVSEDLNRAAQGQADHQAAILTMTHDGNGGLGQRLGAVGYRAGAENVAAGQRSVAEVVQGWIDSPGHHANIVNPDMTEVGFAVAFGADGRSYWAQVFGTR